MHGYTMIAPVYLKQSYSYTSAGYKSLICDNA